MKKTLYIVIISLFINNFVKSQNFDYIPFVEDSTQWSEMYRTDNYHYTIQYKIKGDTIINNINYFKIYTSKQIKYNSDDDLFYAYIREDSNKKVFIKYPETSEYDTSEILLHNFNRKLHDTIAIRYFNYYHPSNFNNDSIFLYEINMIDTITNYYFYDTVISYSYYTIQWVPSVGLSGFGFIENFYLSMLSLFYPTKKLTDYDIGYFCTICTWRKGKYLYKWNLADSCNLSTKIIEENKQINSINFIPNPIISNSKLKLNQNFNFIEIYNSYGQKIFTKKIENHEEFEINNRDYLQGNYIFKIIKKDNSFLTGKFLIY